MRRAIFRSWWRKSRGRRRGYECIANSSPGGEALDSEVATFLVYILFTKGAILLMVKNAADNAPNCPKSLLTEIIVEDNPNRPPGSRIIPHTTRARRDNTIPFLSSSFPFQSKNPNYHYQRSPPRSPKLPPFNHLDTRGGPIVSLPTLRSR